jgi:hypothetical protein
MATRGGTCAQKLSPRPGNVRQHRPPRHRLDVIARRTAGFFGVGEGEEPVDVDAKTPAAAPRRRLERRAQFLVAGVGTAAVVIAFSSEISEFITRG